MNSIASLAVEEEFAIIVADGIARATINRPSARNAISSEIIESLLRLLARMHEDRSIKVLLLDAQGPNFIAGGDVKAFARGLDMTVEERAQDMAERAARAGRLCQAIAEVPQPVVVAARGFIVGVGMSILCASDLAILSETAKLMLSHVSLGISPDGGASWSLPRQVGMKRAKQLAILGDQIVAGEAVAMGLANWVVPDAELDARAQALVRRIAGGAVTAQQQTKALINQSFSHDLSEQVVAEVASLTWCAATEDFAEGLCAVTQKRPARFGS